MEGVSIVIRILNAKRKLQRLFDTLKRQDYSGKVEIIIVDTESIDGTYELAKEKTDTVLTIPTNEFSYPKSLNLGFAAASYPVVISIVGHAYPCASNWISSGVRHFKNPQVAGVFCPVLAGEDGTNFEKATSYMWYRLRTMHGVFPAQLTYGGLMSATNAAFRKSLWEEHPFDEAFGRGGEDVEWALWAISKGYLLMCDPDFVAYHAHHLGVVGYIRQYALWMRMSKPHPFDRREYSFRKDLTHSP